ncbi:hypothetical protein Bca4012_021488 [Brassica carinata]
MESSCIGFEGGSKRYGESKRIAVDSATESTTDSSLSSSSCGAGSSSGRSVSSLSSPPTKSQLLGWPLGQGSWRKSSGKKMMKKNTPTKVDTFVGFKRIGTETSAAILGQQWRLEPLPSEKKTMWRREIEVLLSVSDHIVELVPSFQDIPNGSKIEVMNCRPRSDLSTCLPALRKLDNMLINGRSCLGDFLYRNITSDNFSADYLLESIDLSSEHAVAEMVNRVEASMYIWRRRAHSRHLISLYRSTGARPSWGMIVKEMMMNQNDGDKRQIFAGRAESLLISLNQRFPGLRQTALDTSKIQFNKDVGKSILESYSRVLESLAYSIGVRIEEVLYMDDISKEDHDDSSCSDKLRLLSREDASSRSAGSLRKRLSAPSLFSVSFSGTSTPYRTPSFSASTPTYSPMPLISPISGGGERAPFLSRRNIRERCGFGPKKALANYLRG